MAVVRSVPTVSRLETPSHESGVRTPGRGASFTPRTEPAMAVVTASGVARAVVDVRNRFYVFVTS